MEKKDYILYTHIGCGNRGCEATARSLSRMLECEKDNMILYTKDKDDEKQCGTEQYAQIVPVEEIPKGIFPISAFWARLKNYLKIDVHARAAYEYKDALSLVKKGDLGISTGGDVFCYGDTLRDRIGYLTDRVKQAGGKTVLCACSIEEEKLNEGLLNILNKFDYILPRESFTTEYLKKHGCKNVKQYPDPAFVLPVEEVEEYKELFAKNEYVGINFSRYTNASEDTTSRKFTSIVGFMEHILDTTNDQIMLIPHVFWEDERDLVLLEQLYHHFKNTGRVALVKKHYNCSQLKYIISKCKYFIGARTHSVIAAYSTGVPTLALGYSIKSKGIAQDIFGSYEDYVFDSKQLTCKEELIEAFQKIVDQEEAIKECLNRKTKEFSEELKEEGEFLRTLS